MNYPSSTGQYGFESVQGALWKVTWLSRKIQETVRMKLEQAGTISKEFLSDLYTGEYPELPTTWKSTPGKTSNIDELLPEGAGEG